MRNQERHWSQRLPPPGNVCVPPPNLYVEIPPPQCADVRRWDLWEVITYDDGAFINMGLEPV